MSFFNFIYGKNKNKSSVDLNTQQTDEFADRISVELKTAAVEAITQTLEQKEGKYLKSILETSFFPLQSLVFIPSDFETAKAVEEFVRIHQAIDVNFKENFLRSILQSEYRSKRGGTVSVSNEFTSEIQLDKKSVESRSDEESFQISLRGRKILFRALATLGVPVRKGELSPSKIKENNTNSFLHKAEIARTVKLLITDSGGHRETIESIPLMIGRDPDKSCIDNGVTPIIVSSKFISRRQIYIFSIVDQLFCVVPDTASLTCSTLSGRKLELGKIYPLDPASGERFYCGVPLDLDGPLTGNTDPSEFPIIEINFENNFSESGTPLPKIST
jgi:hypothetical protein